MQYSDKNYLDQLRKTPNAVLHIHLDGSIPAKDLFTWYQQRGKVLQLPEHDITGALIKDRRIHTIGDLQQFQQGLFSQYSLLDVFKVPGDALQTREDIIRMAGAHCCYLQSQSTVYAETRFAPFYHTREGLSMEEVIGAVVDGFSIGQKETGVIVKPIICINREVDSKVAKTIVKAALKYEGQVVGIDLACVELGNPPERFADAYALTFNSSLRRTAHAGEMCSEGENLKNIETCITQLRVDRIGHAIHLYKRPDLIRTMVKRNIVLESSPLSNITCSSVTGVHTVEDLHLDELVEAGVKVTINPDDPAMWPDGDLAHNLYVVGKLYGDTFVKIVLQNACDGSWDSSSLNTLDTL